MSQTECHCSVTGELLNHLGPSHKIKEFILNYKRYAEYLITLLIIGDHDKTIVKRCLKLFFDDDDDNDESNKFHSFLHLEFQSLPVYKGEPINDNGFGCSLYCYHNRKKILPYNEKIKKNYKAKKNKYNKIIIQLIEHSHNLDKVKSLNNREDGQLVEDIHSWLHLEFWTKFKLNESCSPHNKPNLSRKRPRLN